MPRRRSSTASSTWSTGSAALRGRRAGVPLHGSPQCPLLWSADTGSVRSVAGRHRRRLCVGNGDDRISAYDSRDDELLPTASGHDFCQPLWTASTDSRWTPRSGRGRQGRARYSQNGTLYAYDAAGQTNCTGMVKVCEPLWTAAAGSSGSSPVVGRYCGPYAMSGSRLLQAFGAAGGTPLRRHRSRRRRAPLRLIPPRWPTVRVYAGNADLRRRRCDELLRRSDGLRSAVARVGRRAAPGGGERDPVRRCASVPSGGGPALPLQAFDANGTTNCSGGVCAPLWTVDLGGAIFGGPALVNGVLYVATAGDDPPFFPPGILHAYAPG